MGQGHLLWRARRPISEMDSCAPRGALRSIGHLDDRSAIKIISVVIVQVLGSTFLLVEPEVVSQYGFWGLLKTPVGEGLGPHYLSVWAKNSHKLYRMWELGHSGEFLISHHLLMVPHGLYQTHPAFSPPWEDLSQPARCTGLVLVLSLHCDKGHTWVSAELWAVAPVQPQFCVLCCTSRVPWAAASRLGALSLTRVIAIMAKQLFPF